MTHLSETEVLQVAKIQRYLMLALFIGVGLGVVGGIYVATQGLEAIPPLLIYLRIGVATGIFALFTLFTQRARLPGGWLFVVGVLISAYFLPLLSLILMGVAIQRANQAIFKPRGINVGLFGPMVG